MRITVNVPKMTLPSNPVIVNGVFPGSRLSIITVSIPSGHAGLTGIKVYIGNENRTVVPAEGSTNEWLVDDGKDVASRFDPPVNFDMPSFKVRVLAYNTSIYYAHTFIVELEK